MNNTTTITPKTAPGKIKISAGIYKGKSIFAPEIPSYRSVQDIAKQAVFSIIEPQNILESRCLDLFAGGGNMGIEALSREAVYVDFVDENYDAIGVIIHNLQNLQIPEDYYKTHKLKAVKFVQKAAKNDQKYNFIFCDPFYDDLKNKHLISLIPQILHKKGLFVLFYHPQNADYYDQIAQNYSLKMLERRKFGESAFSIYAINNA